MIFNKQKFFIALICTTLGWGIGYEMGQKKAADDFQKLHGKFGIGQMLGLPFVDLFNQPEVIEEEAAPPSWLDKLLGKAKPKPKAPPKEDSFFSNPFSFFGHQTSEAKVTTREDADFVYLDIELGDTDKNSVNTRVENDYVVIEGSKKTEESGSSVSSNFMQKFPVPAGTDPSKVDLSYNSGKIVMKFPKVKN